MSTFNIADLELFRGCSKRELAAVHMLGTNIGVPAGKTLTAQGAYGQQCFVICTGTVDVVRDGETIAVAGPGHIVGEIALLDDYTHVRTATARAATDCEVIAFSSAEFAGLMLDVPTVADRVARTAVHRLTEDLEHEAHHHG